MTNRGLPYEKGEKVLIAQAARDFARHAADMTLSREEREWCERLAARIRVRVPRKRRGTRR